MTNTPTPNPNRRRRLTADELIAVIVAMTGIGSILFWSLGQKYPGFNFANWDPASLTTSNGNANSNGGNTTVFGNVNTTTVNGSGETRSIVNPQPAVVPLAPNNPNAGTVTTEGSKVDRRIIDDEKDSNTGSTAATTIAPIAAGTAAGTAIGTPAAPVAAAPSAVAPTTAPSPASTAAPFKDVPKAFWGEKYISSLQAKGVLDDFGSGKFDPNLPVTRGEFAKMLDRAFKDRQIANKKLGFKDIPAEYKRKEALDRSVNLGFMTGYSATKFAPDAPIPRYQMAIALAKGLKLQPAADADGILSKFADAGEAPTYTKPKMAAAVAADIVVKDEQPDNLKPMQNATRADAAALIYQALVKEGKISAP
jgi:hypothetical protein